MGLPSIYGPSLHERSSYGAYLYSDLIEKQFAQSSKLLNEVTNTDDGEKKFLSDVRNTSTALYFVTS